MQHRIPKLTSILIIFTIIMSINIFTFTVLSKAKQPRIIEKTSQNIEKVTILDENASIPDRPMLAIKKTINATLIDGKTGASLVRPLQWIRVNITIENIGNRTAYNLTIIDPEFTPWVSTSLNVTEQNYVEVDVNSTIFYYYYFQPLIEGNFTIEATEVIYHDVNSTEYRAYSQRFSILSLFEEHEEILDATLWLQLLYYSLGILGFIGLVVLVDYLIHRKPFKKKEMVKKAEPTKLVSKQKQRKKQKKVRKKR
ncbi:MAG: hypothetical protein ACTSSG_05480 [Candidatus Heimdallarchaeaceae archaeon]